MKWNLPAKTFLLGEYAAVAETSAIILTTTPCFELSLIPSEELVNIHPESPAGLWWLQKKHCNKGLYWNDPYEGQGGLGASSAQFLGTYLASSLLENKKPHLEDMLEAYYQCAWSGIGLRPSGYDVIAQSQSGCVYINKKNNHIQSYTWPFPDISLTLVHTKKKLATHHHLQSTVLPEDVEQLSNITEHAKKAFDWVHSPYLIDAINRYHEKLIELNLVADHTLKLIQELKTHPEILAIKGCGALGADVLLIITAQDQATVFQDKLLQQKWTILATEKNILNNQEALLSAYY